MGKNHSNILETGNTGLNIFDSGAHLSWWEHSKII